MDLAEYEPKESIKRSVISKSGVKINNSNTLDMRTFKGVIYYNVTV